MLLDMPKISASATEQDGHADVVQQLERDAVREREDLADVQRGLAGELLMSDAGAHATALGELAHGDVQSRHELAQHVTRRERLLETRGRCGAEAGATRLDGLRRRLRRRRDGAVHGQAAIDAELAHVRADGERDANRLAQTQRADGMARGLARQFDQTSNGERLLVKCYHQKM
jgi:hypothetical protein